MIVVWVCLNNEVMIAYEYFMVTSSYYFNMTYMYAKQKLKNPRIDVIKLMPIFQPSDKNNGI